MRRAGKASACSGRGKSAIGLCNPFTYGLNIALVLAAIGSLTLGFLEGRTVFVAMSSVGFLVGGGNLAYLLRAPQSKMHSAGRAS